MTGSVASLGGVDGVDASDGLDEETNLGEGDVDEGCCWCAETASESSDMRGIRRPSGDHDQAK